MGWFTAFKEDIYPRSHIAAFPATDAFAMQCAAALAWAAQLAYETATEAKLDHILTGWRWQCDAILNGALGKVLPVTIASGFIAHAGSTTIVAFGGTEPENAAQWAENLSFLLRADMHQGFQAGVEAIWNRHLAPAI